MIAVHGGVGFRLDRSLSVACADALRGDEVDVISAVSSLEGNPLFNCGHGSNLTMEGTVECEAGFMSSEGFRMDTVGAVSINDDVVEACTSSGGIILKTPGRLGHCTVFGSGMWAERRKGRSVGVSVSGCGEALTRADFCRSLARILLKRKDDSLPSEIVHSFFEREYLNSEMMTPIPPDRLYAGGIVLLCEDERYELVVFHNTPLFPFAYRHGSVVRKSVLAGSEEATRPSLVPIAANQLEVARTNLFQSSSLMAHLSNALFALLIVVIGARYEDRIEGSQGSIALLFRDLPPPDQIDFAINPVPKFGARALNITHTYFQNGQVTRHDYGYMPVKNATRRDPRVHVAYLTTSSEGRFTYTC
ncbi:hypothetical protein ANCCEY_09360 [Ancylostoma ceylanicum]|uniref:Asparaginase n=1 Tax=Ancylostoma ceylanicum TaxID=53326 RepID=A0A0D6LK49_9BILA|nr:hypothetical protein ANCCEY_09360 [Ancylostoma ceylanicum]